MNVTYKEVFDEDYEGEITDFELHFTHELVPKLKQMFSFNVSSYRKKLIEEISKFIENITQDNTKTYCCINDSGNSSITIKYVKLNVYEFSTSTYSGEVWGTSSFTVECELVSILNEILSKLTNMEAEAESK